VAWPYVKPKSNEDSSELIRHSTRLIVIGTSRGAVKMIDLKKNKVIWKEKFHHMILDLDFNKNGVLAIATASKELYFRQLVNEEMKDKPRALLDGNIRCLQFN
jgi:hypothetical protein